MERKACRTEQFVPKLEPDARISRLPSMVKAHVNLGRMAEHPQVSPIDAVRYRNAQDTMMRFMDIGNRRILETFYQTYETTIPETEAV